jgi:uncharacterized protein YdcH (DUF465 family)
LAQFPEDEAAARELIAKNASFDTLCQEYRNVVDLLDGFETEIKRLKQLHAFAEVTRLKHLRASLEERLLSRIEGYEPRWISTVKTSHSRFRYQPEALSRSLQRWNLVRALEQRPLRPINTDGHVELDGRTLFLPPTALGEPIAASEGRGLPRA